MIFSSIEYLFFFPAVLAIALVLRGRAHLMFLVTAGLIFYGAWNPPFCFILLFTSVMDFYAAIRIAESASHGAKRAWMWASVVINLGLLGFFKYANFFADAAGDMAALFGGTIPAYVFEVTLPVGISFYTFQSMSYALDVYYGRAQPTRSFLVYLSYTSFFPQLVAGPICRSHELIPQLQRESVLSQKEIREGVRLFFRGFVKKAFVADTLGTMIVDPVFKSPAEFGPLTHWLAVIAYAAQIYGDFSGYTDMGRGSAKLLGIHLPINFNFPYLATNPRDYWSRHHITLSTWIRDYIFFPLGGVSRSAIKTCRNIMITFVLGGLWHGASWTFIAWGAYHGLWLIVHQGYRNIVEKISGTKLPAWTLTAGYTILARVASFVLILGSFVFFRSQNFGQALEIFQGLAGMGPGTRRMISGQVLALLTGIFVTHLWPLMPPRIRYMERIPSWMKDLGYALLTVYVIVNLIGGARPFIYFQF